jgi:cyclopropane fatty-acyl-phospholipid synthase-like methyltransferase
LWEKTGLPPDGKDSLVVLDFGCGTGLLTEVLQKKAAQVICVDAAPLMVEQVEEKIRAREWKNVKAYTAVLARLEQSPPSVKQDLEAWNDKVDLVVASSVFSFIPQQDLPGTMKKLGELLKSNGGVLCHSDWPKSDEHPDGMTEESALKMYEMAGLEKKSTTVISMNMMGECFVGVAVKP